MPRNQAGAEILLGESTEEIHRGIVGFLNVKIVGQVCGQAGEQFELGVVGISFLRRFKRLKVGFQPFCYLSLRDRKAPFRFEGPGVGVDGKQVIVRALYGASEGSFVR